MAALRCTLHILHTLRRLLIFKLKVSSEILHLDKGVGVAKDQRWPKYAISKMWAYVGRCVFVTSVKS